MSTQMESKLPLVQEMDFHYGVSQQVSPKIRRVVARNPSPFTYHGTGTYIVGHGEVAVIDPGPSDPEHIQAILDATRNETITHMIVTHTHADHSPGCQLLSQYCDAPTLGFGPHAQGLHDSIEVEEPADYEFEPTQTLRHEDVIIGSNWTLECIHTPGHTSNHMCYLLLDEGSLFSGDHVMGWSTSVISPPDGDMRHYMESLRLLLKYQTEKYWPTHGPPIVNPNLHVGAFIEHRQAREFQIKQCIREGNLKIAQMVALMYKNTAPVLHPAAARSILAAIHYLVERGEVCCVGAPTEESVYTLPN